MNKPVLITGTIIEQRNVPKTVNFFLNNKNKNPLAKPARPVFNMHNKTVATGLIAKNAAVPGANIVTTPFAAPNNRPLIGPYKHAPRTITTNDKLMLIPPIENVT